MYFYHFKTVDIAQNINKGFVKLKSDNIENTIADIETLWTKVDTGYPLNMIL
jgi:putative ABC transport system permease protein